MYFNYPSNNILPFGLENYIHKTKECISKCDEVLKYGIEDFFVDTPFNIINVKTLKEKIDEIRQKFVNASEKPIRKSKNKSEEEERGEVWDDPRRGLYHSLLLQSFDLFPFSLFVKKGVSSSGKEVLVTNTDVPFALFLFHTVYPLCWLVLDDKNKFSISKHPIYPLFHRYIQEPLAIAMSLSVIDNAFGNESHERDVVVHFINDLSSNYSAGIHLYSSGIHLRWKDWKDDSKRCDGKIETIIEWIELFSDYGRHIESEKIIELWAKLFDLTTVEVQGLLSASEYAPVISEGESLPKLILGLLEYVVKNEKEFQNERIGKSDNPIAKVVFQLATKQISFERAKAEIPYISMEPMIRDFIGNVLSGWSFARDLHTGIYRIYGPAVMALSTGGK